MGIKKVSGIAALVAAGFICVSTLPSAIKLFQSIGSTEKDSSKCKSFVYSPTGRHVDGIAPECVISDLSQYKKIIINDTSNNSLESSVNQETRKFSYINLKSPDIQGMIVEAARYYNPDPSFAGYALALARRESDFNPKEISYKDARGVMQVIPDTARIYDPNITPEKLLDPKYNIPIGIAYFSDLVKEYGEYKLAIAAYHTGEGNLNNAIAALKAAKAGKSNYNVFGYRNGKKIISRTIEVADLKNLPDNWDGYKVALKKITGSDANDTINHVSNVWETEYSMRGT